MMIKMANKRTYDIETSLTLDYRKAAWGIERIVLDSISNHLPADSNGARTFVKLKQDGEYVDLREADRQKETTEVIFEDDGSGYDAGLLSVLFSSKAADALSVGQFGEGLKMAASASLRNDIDVEYRSKNWTAKPFARPENIGGHNLNRLCFRVAENGDQLEGSRTVFTNPTIELVEEIFQLPQKVLALNDDYRELHNEKNDADSSPYAIIIRAITSSPNGFQSGQLGNFSFSARRYNSRIIEMGDKSTSLFIKGVRVRRIGGIFSYDLGIDDISPDRIFADRNKVLDEIGSLLRGCANSSVIEKILQEAHDNPDRNCYEFEAFAKRGKALQTKRDSFTKHYEEIEPPEEVYFSGPKDKIPENLWATTFRRMFGENAVVASYNVNANEDAKLMGYIPIKLNRNLSDYLTGYGIDTADKITRDLEYHWLDKDDLTESEREMLGRVDKINNVVLEERIPVDVRVYSGLFTKTEREVESSAGVCTALEDGTKYIGIKRSQLGDFRDFSETYIHELGHYVTGADDYDRRFTDFFVNALAKIARHYIS